MILLLVFLSQIHDICQRVSFDMNFSSFSSVLNCFGKMLNLSLRKAVTSDEIIGTTIIIPAIECLQAIRFSHHPANN